jgi:CheY-like chemotaxis protein
MFKEIAAARGLDLKLSLPENLPVYLRGDPLRLTQIFTNLTGNALKFTQHGGVTLSASPLELNATSTVIEFSVQDTGIGLSEEQLSRLFTAFTQADASTTRRYGGTGLGLVISRRLVEMMHGNIFCVSSPDEGSEFTFTARFELSAPPAGETGSSTAPAPDSSPDATREERIARLAGRHILVAEDNEINQIIIREILEKAGFVVDMADNGRQALEMARDHPYDLIFMDIQMPEMDGLTATREIRKNPSLADLPIVAMTAHAMMGDKEKSLEAGMNDHVTKPIDVDDVYARLIRWIPADRPDALPDAEKDAEKDAGKDAEKGAEKDTEKDTGKDAREKEKQAKESPAASLQPPLRAPESETAVVREAVAKPAFSAPKVIPADMPGMAFSEGLKHLHNNRQVYLKLLVRMSATLPDLRGQINEALMLGDLDAIQEISLAITSSAQNLGLPEMSAAAERLALAANPHTSFSILFLCFNALEQSVDRFVHATASLRE